MVSTQYIQHQQLKNKNRINNVHLANYALAFLMPLGMARTCTPCPKRVQFINCIYMKMARQVLSHQ